MKVMLGRVCENAWSTLHKRKDMNTDYLHLLRNKLLAEKGMLELDLTNLLSNMVGIGEHVHIRQDVEDLVSKIDVLKSQTETLDYLLSK